MKKIIGLWVTFILILALGACSAVAPAITTASSAGQSANAAVQPASGDSAAASATATVGPASGSASEALAQNGAANEDASDYTYDAAAATSISLNGDSITATGNAVVVSGSRATISAPGTYVITGKLSDGQVIVNTQAKGVVRLVLNGVDITCSNSAPVDVLDASKVVILLADHTTNTLIDGASYTFTDATKEEPNAAVFSKADLSISGSGALTVNANFRDGISSKDGLIIASGQITVNAADDGIRGKDYLVVKGGTVTVTAQGDGLKSDNDTDAALGYISIAAGTLQVTAGGDAINAQTDVIIQGGTFTLTSGGGAESGSKDTAASAKGIKGTANVNIDGGAFTINAADDAIHSNGNIVIDGGTLNLSTADDGMHADKTLTINNGDIRVTQSYEGLESAVITINEGSINLVSSDDGINVAGGNDGSGFNPGGRAGGGPGQDTFSAASDLMLYIHGGYIYVDASGDGLDSNGAIEMTGGVVVISGPTKNMDGALDYNSGFKMTGGYIVAAGSSGMAETTSQTSSQPSVLVYLNSSQAAGTLVHIQDNAGKDVLTFAPAKQYQSVAFSSPDLAQGQTYTVSTGGSSTGTATNGLYQGGTYANGTQAATFTIASAVTTVGSGGGRMGGGGPGGRR